MRSIFAGVVGLFGLLVLVPAALGQPRTPREALEENHPGVRFHEVGGRTRIVYGVPMTGGRTADEAAANWLALYGEIFNDGREIGGPDLRQTSRFDLANNRTVYAFRQVVDEVPVEGALARIMVLEGRNGPAVVSASCRAALRPIGGLPAPRVTPQEALATAQQHEAGVGLTRWAEPRLRAIFNEGDKSGGEGQTVWKCIATGEEDSRSFYVDAVGGGVLSWHSNIMRAFDDAISGTVSGKASPGTKPDSANATCPNSPTLVGLPLAKVSVINSSQVILGSAFTDVSGDYEVTAPTSEQVTVKATLVGPSWEVFTVDGDTYRLVEPCPTRDTPVSASTTAMAPQSGVDLTVNNSPAEYTTAQVNAHVAMFNTWDMYRSRIASDYVEGLDDMVQIEVNLDFWSTCNGRYGAETNSVCHDPPILQLGIAVGSTCTNTAYSTWIAHEYAHYLSDVMLDIAQAPSTNGFREGYCDSLGFVTFDTDVFGENTNLCGHVRAPLVTDPQYPVCETDAHTRGELLGAVWIRILQSAMPLSDVRQLWVDWSLTAVPPGDAPGCSGKDQSADEGTLIEVLLADDNDGSLDNGTPNDDIICEAFDEHGIGSAEHCGTERWRSRRCAADCDRSGSLDVFDFLCFQNDYSSGRLRADCDQSTGAGVLDVFDFLCFQRAFAKGCP